MLGKALEKRLSTQKWVDIMKRDSNPAQTWHRIRVKANRAIEHLTLLAYKLPDEKQEEIFDVNKIFKLMQSILYRHYHEFETEYETQSPFDGRRTTLAATLVSQGTEICKNQYRLLMKNTPDLSEPVMSHLRQSVAMCRDIALRSELMERDTKAEKQEMVYLFEWRKLVNSGKTEYRNRFAAFIAKEFKFEFVEFGPMELSKNGKNIWGTFDEFEVSETDPQWSFILELIDADANAILKVFDINGNERARKNLIVKKEHDGLVVYAKKKN